MGISIGLVGLGQFGALFADMFMNHPDVSRVALCDRETNRIDYFANKEIWQNKKKFNRSDVYESLDDILKTDIDALVIITQPWLHAEQAVKAMKAGKHVYSAVPVVWLPDGDETLDWCNKIIETCKETGMRYMLGETSFYRPDAMFCRKKAAEGLFGDFVYAEGEYFHDVDNRFSNMRTIMEARTASKSGRSWLETCQKYNERGIFDGPMHYPTHSVSGPLGVMKAHAKQVTCYGYRNQNNDPFTAGDAFTNETALFEMSNGATVRICEFRECAGWLGKDNEIFRVMGTKGTYSENRWMCNFRDKAPVGLKERQELMNCYEDRNLTEKEMQDPLPPEVFTAFKEVCPEKVAEDAVSVPSIHGGSHPYLVHEFIDAIANSRQPAINAWEAARYMAMGVMAHKSALKDGERLQIPNWGNAPE